MTWGFSGPGEILFGEGAIRELGKRAAGLGSRAFVVTGRDSGRAAVALDSLRAVGLEVEIFPVPGEPDFGVLRCALAEARNFAGLSRTAVPGSASTARDNPDGPPPGLVVVGFGGGSALDLAKAVGILLSNPGDPLDYAEVIGAGKAFTVPSTPVIAAPTTAGTGSEATRNAVFAEPSRGVKVSLRSPYMYPRLALVDPELCLGLPPAPTAYTGMDALTQVLEPFVCRKANPATDALCASALAESAPALRRVFRDGKDRAARAILSRVSLFSGLALGNAGLGVVHGLAAPLGGRFPVPHGAACAALLAPAAAANIRALRDRDPEGPGLDRYARAARLVTGQPDAEPEDLVEALSKLSADLGIPRLSAWGVRETDLASLTADASASNSMKANPAALTSAEIEGILRAAL